MEDHTCSVGGCGKKHYSRGYCTAHYYKFLRHGDPEWQAPVKPGGEVSYRTMHERVQKARGKAAEYQCARCPAQAADWAWIHGLDRGDVTSYTPMCTSCHMKYDIGAERHWKNRRKAS